MHRLSHLRAALLVALLPLIAGPVVVAQESGLSLEKLARIERLLDALVAQKKIAGGVALVSHHGATVYTTAVGRRGVEPAQPMQPDTLFRICSMTKPITSTAVMVLVEEGRLALDDPLSKFVPEFARPKVLVRRAAAGGEGAAATEGGDRGYDEVPAESEITIHQLLTHTSGLTYGFLDREPLGKRYREAGVSDGLVETEGTIAENVRRLARLPLQHHPGTAWEYSLATDVLGRVIEVVSGKTLAEFLAARIFEPLGMADTFFIVPPEKRDRVASVYRPKEDGTIEALPAGRVVTGGAVHSSSYPFAGRYYSGGAGLVSSVPDYARFLRMLLAGGELDGKRILSEASVRRMTRDHCGDVDVWIGAHGDGFGLGFGVVTEKAVGQGLGSEGTYSWGGFYHTYFWVDPKEELIGVVMTQIYPFGHLTLWNDMRTLTYEALTPGR